MVKLHCFWLQDAAKVFHYLTEIGADIIIHDIKSNNGLHHAAIMGSVEIIKILLDKGMYVQLTNATDSMPLHFSAHYGNLEAMKALVKTGAPLNNANKDGATPLLLGARYGKIEVFCYLTEIGADINIHDINSNSALHHAASMGSVEIIKILLDKGMSVDLTNAENSTLHLSALIRNLEVMEALCERGAPLNNADKDGETPLFLAARCGKTEVFHYLTDVATDINIRDVNSNIALHHAAFMGSVAIIKILLHKGMSVELKNSTDPTLHFSAYYGNMKSTTALVERGAPLTTLIRKVKLHCIWLQTMAK